MRPRRRAAGLVFGAIVLFVVGTNVQAGWLFVIAAMLLGAVIAGLVLPFRMVRGVEVDACGAGARAPGRRRPRDPHRHEPLARDAGLADRPRPVPRRHRRVRLASGTGGAGRARDGARGLAPGTAGRRGRRAASDAPFAVAERRRRIEAAGRVLVLPRVEELGDLPFVERAPTHERALRSAPRRGAGPEYLGIREYRPGDSMRHVHWPSTARLGAVMVREFEEETTRRLAIVVDTLTDVGEAWTPLDAACSAAVSVGLAAAARGQGVRLVVREAGEVAVTSPGEEGLLDSLAAIRPDGRSVAATAAELRRRAERHGEHAPGAARPGGRTTSRPSSPAVRDLAEETGRVAVLLVDAATRGAPPEACLPAAALPRPRGRARRRRSVRVPTGSPTSRSPRRSRTRRCPHEAHETLEGSARGFDRAPTPGGRRRRGRDRRRRRAGRGRCPHRRRRPHPRPARILVQLPAARIARRWRRRSCWPSG